MAEVVEGSPQGPSRVALVHPTYWPEVRRGTERFIHDLAAYLSRRGAEVTILTAHRGLPQRRSEDGFDVVRGWRPPDRLTPRGGEAHMAHAPLAAVAVATRRFDLVHAFHIPDAWGASWATRLSGRPLVLSLMGYPDARSLDAFRGRRRILGAVASRARAIHTLSEAAAGALRDAAGIESTPIHLPTETGAFHRDLPRAPEPAVFCAASPADPRKRVPLLVEAFRLLRERRPDARLRLAGPLAGTDTDAISGPGIELLGEVGDDALAEEYASAWVTVLPSEREAFGLVLVESLASGTPAVGAPDGAIPEILDDPRVSVLAAAPGPEELASAIEQGLALAETDGIREACRAHAERWSWERLGPSYESLYRAAMGAAAGGPSGR